MTFSRQTVIMQFILKTFGGFILKKLNDAVDRFAYRHPNFGIPNLMKYVVAGNIMMFLLLRLTNYGIFSYLGFNWGAVLRGQVWRLLSFVFVFKLSLQICCAFPG